MHKTFYDVKEIKETWLADPTWDLENAVGFEGHIQELKCFRLEWEDRWVKENEKRIQKRANNLKSSIDFVRTLEILYQEGSASEYLNFVVDGKLP